MQGALIRSALGVALATHTPLPLRPSPAPPPGPAAVARRPLKRPRRACASAVSQVAIPGQALHRRRSRLPPSHAPPRYLPPSLQVAVPGQAFYRDTLAKQYGIDVVDAKDAAGKAPR